MSSKTPKKIDGIKQQIEDVKANITLLSGWQQAHNNGELFGYGLPGQQYVMHISPETGGYDMLGRMIEAQLKQAGADLIRLRGAEKANLN